MTKSASSLPLIFLGPLKTGFQIILMHGNILYYGVNMRSGYVRLAARHRIVYYCRLRHK